VLDLLITNARLPRAATLASVAIQGDRIVASPTGAQPSTASQVIDAGGNLLTPALVEPHIHLDAVLTVGQPRQNLSGSLFEGIAIWGERVKDLTAQDVKHRVSQVLRWQVANGVLFVRSHVDVCDPKLTALRALVEESTRGDPCSPLLWTTLSVRDIARELAGRGHRCGKNTVARLLAADGFSLQGNSRVIEGRRHPDRDAQFRYISERAKEFLAAGDPVISVDTKKKEPVGQYGNRGRSWRPRGEPVRARDHDFPDPEGGVAIPYGVYDVERSLFNHLCERVQVIPV